MISDVTSNKPRLITLNELIACLIKKKVKCGCGYRFKESDFHCYDHSYGVKLKDFKQKQWIYANCPNCDYDTALWKLFNSLEQDGD